MIFGIFYWEALVAIAAWLAQPPFKVELYFVPTLPYPDLIYAIVATSILYTFAIPI